MDFLFYLFMVLWPVPSLVILPMALVRLSEAESLEIALHPWAVVVLVPIALTRGERCCLLLLHQYFYRVPAPVRALSTLEHGLAQLLVVPQGGSALGVCHADQLRQSAGRRDVGCSPQHLRPAHVDPPPRLLAVLVLTLTLQQ